MQIVNEGLKAGDLEGVVSPTFSVDQYKSKMGDDRNVMVLCFSVDGQAPAKDLEHFAETGYKDIMDADATPGTLEDSKHKVFIEFQRKETVDQAIRKFLDDLKKLTNIETFNFTYHKRTKPFEATAKNLAEVLPRTPEAYSQKINGLRLGEVKAFKIDADSMSECMYFTKYFGPYQISKTTEDKFIFSKGGESVLVSKNGW